MSIYLECDCCRKTYDGDKNNPKGHHFSQISRLIYEAEHLEGWIVLSENYHPKLTLCKACVIKVVNKCQENDEQHFKLHG